MDEMPSATFLNGSWFTGTSSDLYSSNYIVQAERDLTVKETKVALCWSTFPPVVRINAGISASVHTVHEQEFERDTALPAFVFQLG